MSNLALRIKNVSKEYRLGAIGGTTLREEIGRWIDKRRNKDAFQDYGKRFLALDDISFEVKKGERVGIIGHNGAGKSTLLKLLSRVTGPSRGRIQYNGRISSMLEVGTGFHPELTGRENVYMNGAILGMTKKEIDSKIDQIVQFAEMEQFIDTPVKRYSSGMYVKLAFSVAAHLDNDILIMDEVLAVGDMKFQQKCLGKMDDVSKTAGKTVLFVSHNMSLIRQLCTRCIVMSHGRIIFDGDVQKAISLYIKNDAGLLKQHIQFSGPDGKPYNPLSPLRFLSADIRHLGCIVQDEQKHLGLDVHFEVKEIAKAVYFFAVVQDMYGAPIGFFTSDEITFPAGDDVCLNVKLPLGGLMPGRYRVRMTVYHSVHRDSDALDITDASIVFEKLDNLFEMTTKYLQSTQGCFNFGKSIVSISENMSV